MKYFAWAIGAASALLVLVNVGQSGEEKDLRAIVNKAIQFQGGEAKLAKFNAQTMKGTGKFYGLGEAVDISLDLTTQDDKQLRLGMDMTVMNLNLKIVVVVNGDKGWEKVNDDLKDMGADELAEQKEQMHSGYVISLVPLKDKSYKLSALGEVKVGDQPAIGVRVSKKGHREVNLFFDKAKGNLVKSEYMIKDLKAGDKEMTQTNYYSEYKEFAGTKQPTKVMMERDGKKVMEAQMTEYQPLEKADKGTFDRP